MLGGHLQHLIIGTKAPFVLEVQEIDDEAIVGLLPTVPNLVELRLQGFIKLTQTSFVAALVNCRDLQVFVITGTREWSPSRSKVIYPDEEGTCGGYGSMEMDTLKALIPSYTGAPLPGRRLRLVDFAYQPMDVELARNVTSIRGELVIMRELALTTERYSSGLREVSDPVECINLQGNFKTMKAVSLPFSPSNKPLHAEDSVHTVPSNFVTSTSLT